jgi:hypothetical protein
MRALDEAIAAELAAIAPAGVTVEYGSPPRDWRGTACFVHRSVHSEAGRLGAAGINGVDARQYEHQIVAIHRTDPDQAEALRDLVVAHLQWRRLAPAGWTSTTPITWAGEVHDPGDMLPGGELTYFAGDRWTVDIYRQRQ